MSSQTLISGCSCDDVFGPAGRISGFRAPLCPAASKLPQALFEPRQIHLSCQGKEDTGAMCTLCRTDTRPGVGGKGHPAGLSPACPGTPRTTRELPSSAHPSATPRGCSGRDPFQPGLAFSPSPFLTEIPEADPPTLMSREQPLRQPPLSSPAQPRWVASASHTICRHPSRPARVSALHIHPSHVHTHMHMCTLLHVCTQMHMCTLTHVHTHAHIHRYGHIQCPVHAHTSTHPYTCTHTCTHAHMPIHTHAHMHTCRQMHTCPYTHAHITYIHSTHTCTYTETLRHTRGCTHCCPGDPKYSLSGDKALHRETPFIIAVLP